MTNQDAALVFADLIEERYPLSGQVQGAASELRRQHAQIQALNSAVEALSASLGNTQAEREAFARDAERYRWLREGTVIHYRGASPHIVNPFPACGGCQLDDSIDATMALHNLVLERSACRITPDATENT